MTKQILYGLAQKYSIQSIKTKYKLVWGTTNFKVLGILFDVDLKKMIEINFSSKLEKLQNIIIFWKRRTSTPLGKITVVKSLLLPLFTHLFIALPSPGEKVLKQINSQFSNFVWDGPAKIKQTISIKSYDDGGVAMTDIYAFEKKL